MEQYNSIQQLLKKEGGKKNPVFPPTVVQAVFDAKTGASLESILAQFNSVYLQYQGSPKATRLIIPKEMRRAGLTITYMNMEGETITERASSAVQKDNDNWGLEINWSRIDELSLSGDIAVSAQGTWIINGKDTGVKAVGPKGEAGITPFFRWYDNKIQISYDNMTWTDLSEKFADNLYIKGYVATTSALPSSAAQGDIYGVGPTYAAEDTARTNPIYRYYVRNANTWVDNGPFTSIEAGIVQETGNSENVVMSQKAVTEKLSELCSEVGVFAKNRLLKNGETLNELLEFKGKEIYYKIEATNINGALSFFDKDGNYIEYWLGEGYGVVSDRAVSVVADFGDILATVLYEPLSPKNQLRRLNKVVDDVAYAVESLGNKADYSVDKSKNLYDVKSPKIIGFISDSGGFGIIDGYEASGLIEVEPDTTYYLHRGSGGSGTNPQFPTVRLLGDDKTTAYKPLKEDGTEYESYWVTDSLCFKTTSDTRYVQFQISIPTDSYIDIQLEKGNKYSGYEEYYEPYKYIPYEHLPKDLKKDSESSILSNKRIMLFGDSLTSASTPNVEGFGKLIAEYLGIPYRAFLWDYADGNENDTPYEGACVTNYGKDGTTNAKTENRIDSITERVKNHVKKDSFVDYVLIECSVNDPVVADKGTISDSYTVQYDECTTLGAIEETCRYLSTLGNDVHIGFFIPWNISYVEPTYFDEFLKIFKKWGMPYLDLRYSAGFNMRGCTEHHRLYSLSSSVYEDYNNSTTYNLDDKVKYGGTLYKCNADGVVGVPPTNETYWTKVTEGSYDGCHLNSLGHRIVYGKILKFMESL